MAKIGLEAAWQCVLDRLIAEGYTSEVVLETMLSVAVRGLIEEHGHPETAARLLHAIRRSPAGNDSVEVAA